MQPQDTKSTTPRATPRSIHLGAFALTQQVDQLQPLLDAALDPDSTFNPLLWQPTISMLVGVRAEIDRLLEQIPQKHFVATVDDLRRQRDELGDEVMAGAGVS